MVLIFVDVIILLIALVRSDLAPVLIGALITSNVALIIALLNQSSNSDGESKNDPKMVIGKPPEAWPVRISGRTIMGELIGSARLTNQREMMTVGPRSSLRLNPSYHYRLIEFAQFAGLYRVPR